MSCGPSPLWARILFPLRAQALDQGVQRRKVSIVVRLCERINNDRWMVLVEAEPPLALTGFDVMPRLASRFASSDLVYLGTLSSLAAFR